jgi:hypothetical protein
MEISAQSSFCFIFYNIKSNFAKTAYILKIQCHTSIQDSVSSYVSFSHPEVNVPLTPSVVGLLLPRHTARAGFLFLLLAFKL